MLETILSASMWRPWDASQRGDSGMFLRRNQTISAPTPAMANIQRQPKRGMISQPRNAARNNEVLMIRLRMVPKRPRHAAGMNSLSVP